MWDTPVPTTQRKGMIFLKLEKHGRFGKIGEKPAREGKVLSAFFP